MGSRVKIIAGGLATYLAAVYAGMSYAGTNQDQCSCEKDKLNLKNLTLTDEERFKSFSEKAKIYDKGKPEKNL